MKPASLIFLLALTQETCEIKEKLVQLHSRVTFSSAGTRKKRERLHAGRERAYIFDMSHALRSIIMLGRRLVHGQLHT